MADLVLVEGYKSSPLPKIAVAAPELDQVLPDRSRVVALVSPEPVDAGVPVFKPQEVAELRRFIQALLAQAGEAP